MKTEVEFVNRQRTHKVTAQLKQLLKMCCEKTMEWQGEEGNGQVYITFTSDRLIRQYNSDFRQRDVSTDVLSFPMGENGVYEIDPDTNCYQLGDIVLNLHRAAQQAELFGHTFERECGYLTIHSMLHLLGYDHEDEGEQKRQMRRAEKEILAMCGLQIKNEE